MPTYDGTYKLAVEDGRVLIRDVEGGSQSTHVPLEIYSNYAAQGTLTDSRQLRLRTQPYLESNTANAYVTDMGIESGQTDNYFFITAPQKTSNVGDRSTFVISKTSNVGIGTTDPVKPLHVVGDSWVTGTLTTSNIVGASPVTISSSIVMAAGTTLTAGAIEPPSGVDSNMNVTGTLTTSNITHASEVTLTSNLLMGSDKTLTTSNITHASEVTLTSNLLMGSDKTLTTSNIVANTGDNLLINSNLVMASGKTLTSGYINGYTPVITNTSYENSIFKVHKLTSSGTITVTSPGMIEYIMVGGGGGGGVRHAGGGGGGGVLVGTMFITTGQHAYTIGSGGTRVVGTPSPGGNGGYTECFGLRAWGGGGGGKTDYSYTTAYGSTGGTNVDVNSVVKQPSFPGFQGYAGGLGIANPTAEQMYSGGAGGGAGGPGNDATLNGNNSSGGNGGPGRKIPGLGESDQDVYLGGGGGSACSGLSTGTAGDGGIGGGGAGAKGTGTATNGTANTGGGGGGAGFTGGNNGTSGTGGSGVIYIRYPK